MSNKGELYIGDQQILSGFEYEAGSVNLNGLEIRIGDFRIDYETQKSVSFSAPFTNACLCVMLTCQNTTFAGTNTFSASNYSKTGFTAWNSNSPHVGSIPVAYLAIGY